MSKEESTILKGVAILMMLFLHLFNNTNVVEMGMPLLWLGDEPFVTVLSRACNPVAFFVVLSGYGLAFLYSKGRLGFVAQLRRILKLYVHYWLVLLIFVTLGCWLNPDRYPGDGWKVLVNATGYITSYNVETWFLFPYALLSLTAFPLFKIVDRWGNVRSLVFFMVVSMVSAYFYSRYIAAYKLYDSVLGHVLTYLGMIFSFVIGAVMFRMAKQRNLRSVFLQSKPLLVGLMLLLAVALRCVFNTAAIDSFYTILFIWLFLHLPVASFVRSFLVALGTRSMVMWMTHTFFCYYLFSDFIYGFRYPLVIFAVLTAISYVVSIPIMWMGKRVVEWLRL